MNSQNCQKLAEALSAIRAERLKLGSWTGRLRKNLMEAQPLLDNGQKPQWSLLQALRAYDLKKQLQERAWQAKAETGRSEFWSAEKKWFMARQKRGDQFSAEELRLIYNIEWSRGQKFAGWSELQRLRYDDRRRDYARMYGVQEDQVMLELSELVPGKTAVSCANERLEVPAEIDLPELVQLGEIVGLSANLSNVRQEVKDQLLWWRGILIDERVKVSYRALRGVDGGIDLDDPEEVDLPVLESMGWLFCMSKWLQTIAFPKLKKVYSGLFCDVFKRFDAPELREVGRYLTLRKCDQVNLNKLQRVGEDMELLATEVVDLPELWDFGEDSTAPQARRVFLPKLRPGKAKLIVAERLVRPGHIIVPQSARSRIERRP